tara:strand:- start:956 stop:1120 length:165 start_codon:yes stop_codon:yes gene_type:complete
MIGFLVFVMGFSTVWIMWRLHFRVQELDRCVGAICHDLDKLRFEVLEKEFDGKK